jgi:hypothetical protein
MPRSARVDERKVAEGAATGRPWLLTTSKLLRFKAQREHLQARSNDTRRGPCAG